VLWFSVRPTFRTFRHNPATTASSCLRVARPCRGSLCRRCQCRLATPGKCYPPTVRPCRGWHRPCLCWRTFRRKQGMPARFFRPTVRRFFGPPKLAPFPALRVALVLSR
jgi:hypothetical protein